MSSANAYALQLAVCILAVLVVATIVGRLLKSGIAHGDAHAVIDNVNRRIHAWWIIAAVFGMAACFGAAGLALLFGVLVVQALREFMRTGTPRVSAGPWIGLGLLAVVQLILAVTGPTVVFVLLLPVAVSLIAMACVSAPLRTERWREVPAASMLCIYGASHVPALATLGIPTPSSLTVAPALFLVIVVQASDVMQYIAGKLAGRRALAPRLSPGKTIEGAMGGVIGSGALGAMLAPLTPWTSAVAGTVACLLATTGIIGGLILSSFKRRRGLKDWGTLIPGHGGVLDRIDSLGLSAPLLYYLLHWQQVS